MQSNYAIVSCITRNPLLCALTFCGVKRTQITALKQERYVLQRAPTYSTPPALPDRDVWLFSASTLKMSPKFKLRNYRLF